MRSTLAALGIATLLIGALLTTPARAGTSSGLRVVATNVMMLPPPLDSYDNAQRAELIAKADYLDGADIVVLSEAFDNGPSEALKNGLAARFPYQTPVLGRSRDGWDATLGLYRDLWIEDGGVTVLSRWPIKRKVQYVYDPGCGADFLSQKGFVYVQVAAPGKTVHLVGTHVQADDQFCAGQAAGVRKAQFTAIDAFLDQVNIPAGEQVLVAGDLNVDKDSAEYTTMIGALDTVEPRYTGYPYTWDPVENQIAAERDPGGAQLFLDYVMYRRSNAGPSSWMNTALKVSSPPWSTGGKTYTAYSDHYPVAGCTGSC